ncbi:quinone-dependent dihydroorotate dehydrogenase [Phormidesmis priestleyi ULC007]|uniref:Dihydroorotate dehydrogenase (quinone) n=1 Tax=Phormidesmis priestleyi ULC007 TaxID=1920490 RepID=A0A2T1DBM8_9CYAN|nr:quinone-dependent dihydroorotate dehydrogenase [Phormidesmis priestleyi]PSB17932.1 quinone-dependent dihydroorotate dehydrogenase [Phormidesmis priestleyi ULC007]PZO53899.1 MAG: quinone-dependent dihydroorotate dehydrogenase [Phormidesmis priestleyi]
MTDIYPTIIRPILFSGLKADPEWLHQQTLRSLNWLDVRAPLIAKQWVLSRLNQSYCLRDDRLKQTLWGQDFSNPIGLAAGFDKDGIAANLWSGFGFGFAELGTVTFHAQPGNPRPRLFRLPVDRAALNRMGFNNQGAAALAQRLQGLHDAKIPLGVNLGKSKVTPLEAAAVDYLESFKLLKKWGDYFVVNVSSPNTPGLRSLQSTDQLEPILSALQAENQAQKPLLIKIAPDLEWEAIADVLSLAQQYNLAGIIATNTTIRRDGLKTETIQATGNSVAEEAGGISGAPLRQRSTEVIRFIYQQTQGRLPIVGVGGIFTAEDAWEKITAGASLIQVYTGWFYEGPGMVRRVLEGLLQKLDEHELHSLQDAIGLDHLKP